MAIRSYSFPTCLAQEVSWFLPPAAALSVVGILPDTPGSCHFDRRSAKILAVETCGCSELYLRGVGGFFARVRAFL
jgi:hypothetical protein